MAEDPFERELSSKTARHIREVRTKEAAQPKRDIFHLAGAASEGTRHSEAIRKHNAIEAKDKQRESRKVHERARQEVAEMMESRSLRYSIDGHFSGGVKAVLAEDQTSWLFVFSLTNDSNWTTDIELTELGPKSMLARCFDWKEPMHRRFLLDGSLPIAPQLKPDLRFRLDYPDSGVKSAKRITEEEYDALAVKAKLHKATEEHKLERKRGNRV